MKKLFLLFLVMGVLSCSNEESYEPKIIEEDNPEAVFNETKKTDSDNILNEYSQLIGNTLKQSEVREYVDKSLDALTEFGDKVSLSYLLGSANGLRENEPELFVSSKASKDNPFTKQLKKEVKRQRKQLKHVLQKFNVERKSLDDENVINFILESLSSEDLEIYVPSKELENEVADDVFYVSYEPSYFTKTNEAYRFDTSVISKSGVDFMSVIIEDDFIEVNKTYIVKVIDPCEQLLEEGEPNNCLMKAPTEKGPPEPLDPNSVPTLLTYNVNHTTVEQKDILSTRLAWFRVKGKDWLGFAAAKQKLSIHRGTSDGATSISGGEIVPGSQGYRVANLDITRRAAKKKYWREANVEFDDDWQMSENEQAIAVFSRHNIGSEASTELSTKTSYKVVNGELTATTEPTATTKVTVKEGKAVFRDKRALSRRQVLATIVGKGVTGESYPIDGVEYNVKQAGIFEYVLLHYYTEIE